MKRLLVQIVVCLLLGAITTVLVAWGFAAFGCVAGHDTVGRGRTSADDSGWVITQSQRPGLYLIHGVAATHASRKYMGAAGMDSLELIDPSTPFLRFFTNAEFREDAAKSPIIVRCAGWPATALWCEIPFDMLRAGSRSVTSRPDLGGLVVWVNSPPLGNITTSEWVLAIPIRPMWDGLAIDTTFFGAVWLGLLTLRRAVRARAIHLSRRSVGVAVTVSILLAVPTTVLVAWSLALCADEEHTGNNSYGTSKNGPNYASRSVSHSREPGCLRMRSSWQSEHRRGFTSGPGDDGPVADFLPYWTDYLAPSGDDRVLRILDARGWPMLAMWGGFESPQRLKVDHYPGELGQVKHAIVLPRGGNDEFYADLARVIPLAPIWLGFVVDTLFYAVCWLAFGLLLIGPGVIRRTIRHRRGLCLTCGYDLRGHTTNRERCPECSTAIIGPAGPRVAARG